jgi:hypothetical protein
MLTASPVGAILWLMAQSRRSFIKMAMAAGGVAAAVGAGVFLPSYLQRKKGGAGAAVLALFGDLRPGTKIDRWTLVEIADVRAGCIPVLMAAPDGTRFQVDIAARDSDGPKPVAETNTLALYLVNGGGGTTSTIEEHGLGVMALAAALKQREQSGAVAPQLVKLRERKLRYPDTPFRVFG